MAEIAAGTPVLSEISPGELKRRVAVIKRFKELLKAQRDRFRVYLESLDKQKDVIMEGSADDLIRHVDLEEKIVADIFSIQKVIDPLEKMYHAVNPSAPALTGKHSGKASGDDEVSGLKEALDGLRAEAVVRSERNRVLLSKRMVELRSEIKNFRGGAYAARRFGAVPAPSQIDIRG
jgi:hypothetical protein